MASRQLFELVLTGGASDVIVPIASRPILVGRDPSCEVVLTDPSVSRRHAVLVLEGDGLLVQDLASRNGTFIQGNRLHTATMLKAGQVVRFGRRVEVLLRGGGTQRVALPHGFVLIDEATGLRYRLGPSPVRIGTAPESQIRLSSGRPYFVAFMTQGGEVWMGDEEHGMVELQAPCRVDVAGRGYAIERVGLRLDITDLSPDESCSYQLKLDRSGGGIPRVLLVDPASRRDKLFTSTNRAILLYLLARPWLCRPQGSPHHEYGWVDDDDVVVGVWGKRGATKQLRVLLCRVRSEISEAGFDPWFVQKRRGQLRINIASVQEQRLSSEGPPN